MRARLVSFLASAVVLAVFLGGCARVIPEVATDERGLATQSSDAVTADSIRAKIMASSLSKSFKVNVHCFNSHVYLVGEADKAYADFAIQTAHAEKAVKAVTTRWFPVGSSNTLEDEKLMASVKTALIEAKNVSSNQVHVDVYGGQVVLLGIMYSKADINRALNALKRVEGIKGVTNYLTAAH